MKNLREICLNVRKDIDLCRRNYVGISVINESRYIISSVHFFIY